MKFVNLHQYLKFASGICIVLLFFGALFFAKKQDPFLRKWFTLNTVDGNSFKCVIVLPKPIQPRPVIVYAHGSGNTLMNDGSHLRHMAELGLAVISLEYDQNNTAISTEQFEALFQYLSQQSWLNTNAIAWVGFSLGANRMLDYALKHPEQQPQLIVQLSSRGLEPSTNNHQLSATLHSPVLLIHSDQDEIFPIADTRQMASMLQTKGVPAQLKIIHGSPHGLDPDRGVIFRCIGEYCRSHLLKGGSRLDETLVSKSNTRDLKSTISRTDKDTWLSYHSIAQWQAEAPSVWLFYLPAAAWGVACYAWRRHRYPVPVKKINLRRHEIALRWLATILSVLAMAETALHLIPPHLVIGNSTLVIARRYLIQPKERADFDFLASQSTWKDQKLKALLDHVELAGYNRELINWKLDEKIYRNYVLSPVISLSTINYQLSTGLNWRRPLWEEFYPRIRHENSPADAARIVVRHLRERVTIAALPNLPQSVPEIWLRQITDETGFQTIYVAALRSVGVPARLNASHQAEFYDGSKWQSAPSPCVVSWL